ncbi:tyrosine--tRNA ligase [Pseudokineococcus marinus]|uniref:Tyrosine--tRNA ligase n=1 Tax=Pseudokineococcus marinus TaxID=351215 RepID=A0A849BN73_9ACTN|nr:tyrosine--tRNA ligase [Pseudokineococcus marinus]NNH22252.1 tyrosine--tRNA ligase [Pseudokineococcus marinus]
MSDVLEDLRWRGLVAQSTDEEALRAALARPCTFYVGFDPTAPSLHIGSLVQILVARRLQRAGHHPLLLVGGATGLIGDPKPTAERQLNDADVVAGWVDSVRRQIEPFVDLEGPNAARMVDNMDWTSRLSAVDLLRDVGRHFRVGRMLAKDAVAARMASDEGISFTEFSYQVLQGMDYLELWRRHGCTLQFGGSDQWGNITAGVDLVHRAAQTQVHAFTVPLVTKADGTKFGKTESGTVWLDPSLTSPYAFHQFWLRAEDAAVDGYLRVFTDRSREELEALATATAERPGAREAQRALAHDVTALVHGEAAVASAEAAAAALFGRGDLEALDEPALTAALAELPQTAVGEGARTVVELLTASGLSPSRSAARRAVADGGAYVNNVAVRDGDAELAPGQLLHGRWAVLRRGKRTLAAVDARPR